MTDTTTSTKPPPKTNVFGERICDKENCPLFWNASPQCGAEGFCNALMDFTGRVAMIDGKVQYGMLCKLPIGYNVVMED